MREQLITHGIIALSVSLLGGVSRRPHRGRWGVCIKGSSTVKPSMQSPRWWTTKPASEIKLIIKSVIIGVRWGAVGMWGNRKSVCTCLPLRSDHRRVRCCLSQRSIGISRHNNRSDCHNHERKYKLLPLMLTRTETVQSISPDSGWMAWSPFVRDLVLVEKIWAKIKTSTVLAFEFYDPFLGNIYKGGEGVVFVIYIPAESLKWR